MDHGDGLTGAERRFLRARRRIGWILAPLAGLAVATAPFDPLSPQAHRLAAVAAFVVTAWITEALPLPVTALLAPALATLFGVAPAKAAFSAMAHPLIFLFLGGFLLAEGLSVHGVDRRLALWVVGRRFVRDRPLRAATALVGLAFGASMWLSNTATTAILLPVIVGFAGTTAPPDDAGPQAAGRHRRFVSAVAVSVAYAASLGGMVTPVGTGPNLVALGLLRDELHRYVDFLAWVRFAAPVAVTLLLVQGVAVLRTAPPAVAVAPGLSERVRAERAALGPMGTAARRVVAIFVLAVLGWLAPSVARVVFGVDHPLVTWARAHLQEGVVAVCASALLFAVPQGGGAEGALLSWRRAARIDWGTLLLLGGGLCLGDLAIQTGLAEAIGEAAVSAAGPLSASPAGILSVSVVLVVYLTEVTSNTATTAMMLPVVMGIAQAAGLDPAPAMVAVTLAASCAFMLPVATPPNAMVYGSGLVRFSQMVRLGFVLDLAALVVLLTFGAFVLPRLVPGP